ncbi:MAG: hypothetical protein R3E66_16670 [bacterium]
MITKPNPFPEFDDSRNTNLSVRAILALGRLRTPSGIDFLFERLKSTSDLAWQQAYLRALAFSTDPAVADRLDGFVQEAPESLQDEVKATSGTIRRRASLQEIEDAID